MNIVEFRQNNPEYSDLSDQELADALHSKYYSDVDKEEFNSKFLGDQPTEVSTQEPSPEKPEKDIGWWDEFKLAYDTTYTDVQDWGLALEAAMPVGNIDFEDGLPVYRSPAELYGADFENMSYEKRKAYLADRREFLGKLENIDTILYQEDAGKSASAEILGTLTGALATPTTVVPFGKTKVAQAATGAAIGAETAAAKQLVEGEFDPVEFGMMTGIGAVAPAATEALVKGAATVTRKGVEAVKEAENKTRVTAARLVGKEATPRSQKKADKMVDKLEQEYARGVVEGLDEKAIVAKANETLGVTTDDLDNVLVHASRQPVIPNPEAAVKIVAARENPLATTSTIGKALDKTLAPISTVIKNIDKQTFARLRKYEKDLHVNSSETMNKLGKFITGAARANKTNPTEFKKFQRALFNGEVDEAKFIASESTSKEMRDLLPEIENVRNTLNGLYGDLKNAGVKIEYRENYFPRVVKDYDGLMRALGTTRKSEVEQILEKYAKSRKVDSWRELDDPEISQVISQYLQRRRGVGGKPSITKERKIEKLDDVVDQYYYSAPESLEMYITRAVRESEKRKFFGSSAVNKEGTTIVDTEASVASYIAEAAKRGMDTDQLDDLRFMLMSRFGPGEQAAAKPIAGIKNFQYMALLGQFESALTQLGDVGSSMYLNGMLNTIKSIFSKKAVTVEDMGLVNKVAAEMSSINGTGKALDFVFKWGGFSAIDKLGKETLINSSLQKWSKIAKKNPEAAAKRFRDTHGDDVSALIDDLANDRMTDNVKLMLWNELSDVQPISLSEMPKKYLDMPNGRILYALKTFTLKQFDLIRRDMIDKARAGGPKEKAEAMTNALRYATAMGLSGATVQQAKDILTKGELDPESFPEDVYESLMSIMLFSRYARERYLEQGRVGEFIKANVLTVPAFEILDKSIKGVLSIGEEEEKAEKAVATAVKNVPIIGKQAYYWLFGGAERKLEYEAKQKAKERSEELKKAGIN
jgi:hypothetical protein